MEVKTINYDLLTGKLAGEPVHVSSQQMWDVFLTSLNARLSASNWINKKEIAVLSWILAQPYKKCYFSKPNNEVIMDNIDNLSRSELTRIKKRLMELGLIEEKLEDGIVRTYPNATLLKLKSAIAQKGAISFSFNMIIDV